jgi:hypothetical protein
LFDNIGPRAALTLCVVRLFWQSKTFLKTIQ